MKFTTPIALLGCLALTTGHAEDFVCPDAKSKKLDRERWKIDHESGERASVDRAIDALVKLASRATRPEDRFVFQSICNDIALTLIEEGLVEEKASSLDACPESTVDDVAQRREKRERVYGDNPVLPIVRVAPRWPDEALEEGLSGEVIVEFTVTAEGHVKNPVVVESTNDVFVENTMRSVKKFKYEPREEDGKPVDTHGVRDRIVFDYEQKLIDDRLFDCPW